MKHRYYFLLFLLILGTVGCNNTNIDDAKSDGSSGDIILYKWMKFETVNNTNLNVSYDMSLIDIKFDVSNDCRSDESVDIRLINFKSFNILDKDKFESLFEQELADKTLYHNYYNPTGDDTYEDMTYNPLQEYYNWDLVDVSGNLPGGESKRYYCRNYWRCEYGVSAIYSVLCRLTIGGKKFILPGWEQSLYAYDATDDAVICHNLDICQDFNNPQNELNLAESPCFTCDCYELTITVNGDTTSDIAVAQNCVNPRKKQ